MPREQPSSVPFPAWRDRVRVENSPKQKPKKRVEQESILHHFDKIASAHLKKHSRQSCPLSSSSCEIRVQKSSTAVPKGQRPIKFISRGMTNSISNIDIVDQVSNTGVNNKLIEEVDKLVRAEEVDKFVQVAAAVAAVPPELVEEAALAVAHGYQTQSITTIKEDIPGNTVIEVLGYIGIRRRKDESARADSSGRNKIINNCTS